MPTSLRRLAQGQQFSSAAASKPSGGIRSLHSLSAWGLPTPVVALACIGNVDIQVFSCADGESYFLRRLQAGGGVHSRSILSRAAVSKPSGGIRSFPSLSACGLPTPIVALAFICNVDIQTFSCADGEPYFLRRFASWWRGLPTKYNFWGCHVETVRRNSLVALAVRLWLANADCCPCLYR